MNTIALDKNGNFLRTNGRTVVLSGRSALAQRVRNRLALWKGEFFLSDSESIDWKKNLQQGYVSENIFRSEISDVISQDPEIESITTITIKIDEADSRKVLIDFVAASVYGTVTEEL